MKKTWKIDIDCPNCAAKVERALQKLPGVVSVSVNYVQKKITLEAADERFEEVRKAAYAKMKEIEPDAEIFFDEAEQPSGTVCPCGGHHHEDDDEDEHEHHHHHDHDDDDHDEHCCCGHHHHHHGHDADEVFTSWGMETAKKFTEDGLRAALAALEDEAKYGAVLRAKGIVAASEGEWIHFDYTPGEINIRRGSAGVTGRLCVIGHELHEDAVAELFR